MLFRSAAERATLKANRLWWEELGVEHELWSARELANSIRLKGLQLVGGDHLALYYVPRDAKLRNPRHVQALRVACERLGVVIHEETEVVGFTTDSERVRSVRLARSGAAARDAVKVSSAVRSDEIASDRFCITAGAWSNLLLGELNLAGNIYPVRGQMLLFRFPEVPFSMVINEGHRYLVPREDGRVLVGSCEEEVGFNLGTTEAMERQLREWAESLFDEFRSAELEAKWSGLRPGSIDSFPYLGTLHPFENAYLASGHFRHGLHWSTATGVLMAQHMLGEPTEIDLEPFRVHRGNMNPEFHFSDRRGNKVP